MLKYLHSFQNWTLHTNASCSSRVVVFFIWYSNTGSVYVPIRRSVNQCDRTLVRGLVT